MVQEQVGDKGRPFAILYLQILHSMLTMYLLLSLCVSLHVVHYKEFEGVQASNSSTDRTQWPPKVSAESVVLTAADGADPGHLGVTLRYTGEG